MNGSNQVGTPRALKENGFNALPVDFTAITGQGAMVLVGNSLEENENVKLGTVHADDRCEVVKGALPGESMSYVQNFERGDGEG